MNSRKNNRIVAILIVEDNPGDIRLLLEIFKEIKVKNKVTVVRDGEEAMELLNREESEGPDALPDLILLDWNLPKKNGYEVVKELKSNRKFKFIPVIVFTSSEAEEDVFKAYDIGANCFITKPTDFEQLSNVIKIIEDFWMTTVKLPRR